MELGALLFFDSRLSGDGSTSCSTCHQPARHWTDGLPLSTGYPGSLCFRNMPSIVNTRQRYFWDGRIGDGDLATVARDHVAETHFM